MTSRIDTRVHGDPRACFAVAQELADQHTRITKATDDLVRARNSLGGSWEGAAAAGFFEQSRMHLENLDKVGRDLDRVHHSLVYFATTLRDIRSCFEGMRKQAAADGLVVDADGITVPASSAIAARNGVAVQDAAMRTFHRLSGEANLLRERERSAHDLLQSSIAPLTSRTGLVWFLDKASLIPPDGGDGFKNSVFGAQVGNNGASWNATWQQSQLQKFRPRWPKGSTQGRPGAFRSINDMSAWEKIMATRNPDNLLKQSSTNWMSAPKDAAAVAKWAKWSKATGIAGGALTGVASAYDQWTKDADDPSMSTGMKTARATLTGVGAGGGALAGATVGAEVGAAIGVLGGPVGVAVGGIAGGIIGGVVGSSGGQWFGEKLGDAIRG
ncbi:hypothetical protein KEM60_00288 [Austwickia sp. TVS 96-490-7B]|uniref:WXG100 family type VII secretion target n=1 Tax=Austwickia sp. TVS 96-490-7B TaxID=2830843 RepID=UPI001C55F8E0|nr:hypothetical protein [Austwickia sp. TVS 96-490-7B]MBW3084105.1 hypothetical protein [Austwickia sp. TVS 96-490-7B]